MQVRYNVYIIATIEYYFYAEQLSIYIHALALAIIMTGLTHYNSPCNQG